MAESNLSKSDHTLLVRLEERVVGLKDEIRELKELNTELKDAYVSRREFFPIQRSVYAAIGLIVTGFLGSLIYIVMKFNI
jgi:preprotein translocase subunit Sss1